jgi:predicted nucleic acid-binding protein
MKIVVCDTGPILHLREAGLLNLLERAGRVAIPNGVDSELSGIDASWRDPKPSWISVEMLTEKGASDAIALYGTGLLGMGEAEAVIMAKYLKADWFLTDDTAARTFANTIGLEVHGSLGVILWAAAVGFLTHDEAKMGIEKLAHSSLWISENILEKAYKGLDKLFVE